MRNKWVWIILAILVILILKNPTQTGTDIKTLFQSVEQFINAL